MNAESLSLNDEVTVPVLALALIVVGVAGAAYYFGRAAANEETLAMLKRMKDTADERRPGRGVGGAGGTADVCSSS